MLILVVEDFHLFLQPIPNLTKLRFTVTRHFGGCCRPRSTIQHISQQSLSIIQVPISKIPPKFQVLQSNPSIFKFPELPNRVDDISRINSKIKITHKALALVENSYRRGPGRGPEESPSSRRSALKISQPRDRHASTTPSVISRAAFLQVHPRCSEFLHGIASSPSYRSQDRSSRRSIAGSSPPREGERTRASLAIAQVVAKCSRAARASADVTTYRVGKHLASRAAYIHAAVTQLSRGFPRLPSHRQAAGTWRDLPSRANV